MSNVDLFAENGLSSSKLRSNIKTSRDGYHFEIYSNIWNLNKDVQINFQAEVLALEPETLDGLRKALAHYAEDMSSHHTYNMYMRFQRMVRDTGCKKIDENVIRNWRAMLDREHEWYLGALRGFLISWHDYGYKGISSKVVNVLERMRLSGNTKGFAVANRCPHTGAFTQHEQVEVANEMIRLFAEGEISLPCYSYLSTLQATARRPVQIRQLKAIDLQKEYDFKTGAVNFYLNIPRAKQRGVGFRELFKRLAITEELYLTLLNLAEMQQGRLERAWGKKLTDKQKELTPLFADWSMLRNLINKKSDIKRLDAILVLDALHMSANSLSEEFIAPFCKRHQAISERTGDIIAISSRRFRRTRGSNLGCQGVGPYLIAEALDQSDIQNVTVYTENTADTVSYIDKAVGGKLAMLARAFKGEIIENLTDGERGDDPTARIPNEENEVVGACGTDDFCVKGYESCYLCEKFRPLLDAPHEKFLNSLYIEKEARLKSTKSETYASTKDTLILAVEWVVQTCQEKKKHVE
ncbi:site-specific integrase [Oceanimonas smirnovii]|uniref:site-specific integrase n=1 Tax=Oceanimonas smirnovii TaxID=264574 RepID=UPI003AAB0C85